MGDSDQQSQQRIPGRSAAHCAVSRLTLRKRAPLAVLSLLIAAVIWLPAVHLFFRPAESEVVADRGAPPLASRIAERHLRLWTDPQLLERELARMRLTNAEWDFMGRSFLVWGLANMALHEGGVTPDALAAMDRIIDNTLVLERDRGFRFFLMPYGQKSPFVQTPARSQFVDGEIALMLAMRCVVSSTDEYRSELARRVDVMVRRMESSPSLSAESYPDECWTFCNAVALAAIRVSDYLDGRDHSGLIGHWLDYARRNLIDSESGLLISAYRLSGELIYRPEGSSIWMVIHCLALVDEPFARQQYTLATGHLAREYLGFGLAREWPVGAEDHMDVDSALVVSGIGASVASTGLAFVAAGTFGDVQFTRSLATSLQFLAFPIETDDGLQFAGANQVGEAAVLYGLMAGAVWEKVRKGRQ